MGSHKIDRMGGAVVGGQEDEVVAFSDLAIEIREEGGEVLVEAEENVLFFNGVGAVFMADIIGRGAVDGQEIGGVTPTERIAFDGSFREIQRKGVAEGGTANIVMVFLIETGDVMWEDG